jgi:cell division protein FtsB
MKNILILVLTVTTIGLGALCVVQWQKLSGQKVQIVSLRQETEQKTQEIADLQASQKLIEQQRRAFLDQAADLAVKLQARQQADARTSESTAPHAAVTGESAKPAKDKNPFGDFFAKLMEDPETKKMIRDQQRVMLDQMYGPLVKKLNLTPEEADQFKDLIADNMMKATEKAGSLFGGDSATNRTERLKGLAEEQKAFEEQVRGFLGETRYAQYQDYQQTVSERTQLNQFQQQYGGGENALSEQQTERLLAIMKEEKQSVAATAGQASPGAGQDAANLEAMFSSDATEKLMQTQESINQRVYERAREVLSENQLASFGRFQTNQLQMTRMGMNMAR